MMVTKAIHKLGDISRNVPDLCFIHKEDEKNYIGNWVTGFGFVNVKFPKETTRLLTEVEIEKYDKMGIRINSMRAMKLNVKEIENEYRNLKKR